MSRRTNSWRVARALEQHPDLSREVREFLDDWRCRRWLEDYLRRTDPAPGQRPDTHLGTMIADLNVIRKAGMGVMTLPITPPPVRLSGGGWLFEAMGVLAEGMQKTVRSLKGRVLGQMGNPELPKAGAILETAVDGNGVLKVTARLDDELAALKVRHAVYPLVRLVYAGDEFLGFDLVDNDNLGKAAGGDRMIAKYRIGGQMKAKKLAKAMEQLRKAAEPPRLPVLVEKALQERQAAEDAYRALPALHTKAAFQRADEAVRKAAIAATRANPASRLGGPRYSL